jgi:hypothetical protein
MYALDTQAAKAANAGGRIDTTGKYNGTIKRCIMFTNQNGTDGVEFEFVDSTGAGATMTLWTRSQKNPKLSGYNVLMSMMVVCGIRNLSAQPRMVKKYDYAEKAEIDMQVTVAPEFDNKPITLLLQREEYEKNNGDTGYRMNIYAAVQQGTDLSADEILDRKTVAEQVNKLLGRLADKKAKPQQGGSVAPTQQQQSRQDNLDDDLPF